MYNNLSHLHGAISFNQTLITHLYVSRCANMPPSLWCAIRFPFLSCNSCRDSFPVCLQHPATVTSGLTLHSVPFPPETGSCCVPGPEREHWGLLSFVTKEGSANSPGAGSQGGPVIRTGIVCVCVCVYRAPFCARLLVYLSTSSPVVAAEGLEKLSEAWGHAHVFPLEG